jgi:hypothetical protein
LALASIQPPNTKDLVKELLSEVQQSIKAGDPDRAEKALGIAPVLLSAASKQKAKADPEYFTMSVEELDNIQRQAPNERIAEQVRAVRFGLATYRSALQTVTIAPDLTTVVLPKNPPYFPDGSDSLSVPVGEKGIVWDFKNLPPGKNAIAPLQIPFLSKGVVNDNPESPVFLINGTQQLDGLKFVNMVFVNMHIVYYGGPVLLDNVKFVDCTFEFSPNKYGEQLANGVALALPHISITT